MKKIVLSITFIMLFGICKAQSPNPNVWTKDYEKQVYDICYATVNILLKREDQKKLLADCQVQKIKKLLPNGLGNNVTEAVKHIIYQTGFDCALQYPNIETNAWTPEVIKNVRETFLRNPQLNVLSDPQKKIFCDCYLNELIVRYPNGVKNGVPQDIKTKIAKSCAEVMKRN